MCTLFIYNPHNKCLFNGYFKLSNKLLTILYDYHDKCDAVADPKMENINQCFYY